MYLRPRTKIRLHFNHNLTDFDEDAYFPNEGHQIKRSPMRRRYNREGQNPWMEWLDHGNTRWRAIHNVMYGLLDKYVGKPYNDLVSVWRERVFNGKLKHIRTCKRQTWVDFLNDLEDEFRPPRFSKYDSYYIDDDGIIRKTPPRPHSGRNITIYKKTQPVWNDQYIYTLKADALLSVSTPFKELLGVDLYNEILSKKVYRESELYLLRCRIRKRHSDTNIDEAFNKVRRYREHRRYYYGSNPKWVSFLFDSKYNNVERVILYGTKEYFKYIKEQKRAKALAVKAKKNPDRTNFDNTLKEKKIANNGKKRTEDFERRLKDIFKREM